MVRTEPTEPTEPTEAEPTMAETITTDGTVEEPAPVMPADLSMVVLSVRDMPALRDYYRALGWQEQSGGSDSLSIFQLGGVALALHPQSEPEAVTEPTAAASPDRSVVTLVVRLATRDQVGAAFASAVRAGGHAVSEPVDQPWGGRSGLVADPEGNRWELLWVARPSAGSAPASSG